MSVGKKQRFYPVHRTLHVKALRTIPWTIRISQQKECKTFILRILVWSPMHRFRNAVNGFMIGRKFRLLFVFFRTSVFKSFPINNQISCFEKFVKSPFVKGNLHLKYIFPSQSIHILQKHIHFIDIFYYCKQ